MPDPEGLTADQRAMVALWEQHLAAEFARGDAAESCSTMTEDASVNHVPTMTGGRGRAALEAFYARHFIPCLPPDLEQTLVSRTVGADRIVDELALRCTHSARIDWLAPGIEPTGRRLELAIVVVVQFRDGKMASERIYWDQASALVQLGLINASGLPVAGAETARKVLDDSLPSNELIHRHGDGG